MRVGGSAIPIESKYPLRGLDLTHPATEIAADLSAGMLNMLIRNGVLRRRAGYYQLGQRLVGGVRQLIEPNLVDSSTGTLINPLVAMTTRRQYVLDDATGKFVDLTPNQINYPIVGVDIVASKFTISGDHKNKFPKDLPFPVVGSSLNDDVYTVYANATYNSGPDTTDIVVVEVIPDGAIDGQITLADDWENTPDQGFVDYATMTDTTSSRLFVTNGVDPVRTWDGDTANTFIEWVPSFDTFQTCKTIEVFRDHLILGGVVDQTHEPALIAWSDISNADEFKIGTSGVQILTGVVGQIRRLLPLGDRLVVYSDDSIISGTFVGLPAVFSFETIIPHGTRFSSENAVVSIDIAHVFAAEDNILAFDGTRALRRVGDNIKKDYKNVRDVGSLHLATGLNDSARGTVYLAFPDINNKVTVYTLEYDPVQITNLVWGKEIYADKPETFGFYTKHTVLDTWQDNLIEQQNYPNGVRWVDDVGIWFDESGQIGFPSRVFGTSDGYVYLVTETNPTDNGTDVISTYETKDFSIPRANISHIGRWLGLEFEGLGESVEISYSTDKGVTYVVPATGANVSLEKAFTQHDVDFDVSSRTLRLRFTVLSGIFRLRWLRLWGRPGGPL